MKPTFLGLLTMTALAAACVSDASENMRQDARGNYASTTAYKSLDRVGFTSAMEAGLRDFDLRLASLGSEAQTLGTDALDEYHGYLTSLRTQRSAFAARLEQHRAMLDAEWRADREDVAEMYTELREDLDDAYADVVEEAS